MSRRAILKGMGLAPLLLRPGAFRAATLLEPTLPDWEKNGDLAFSDTRLTPRYPIKSPLEDILRLVPAGSDEYVTEKYAVEIHAILDRWGEDLRSDVKNRSGLLRSLDSDINAYSLKAARETPLRSGFGIDVVRRDFLPGQVRGSSRFVEDIGSWLAPMVKIETSEFEIYAIEIVGRDPLSIRIEVRYDVVGTREHAQREERVGSWRITWAQDLRGSWKATAWIAESETVCLVTGPGFVDVTFQSLSRMDSYKTQLMRGADYWRTTLDGAIGVDVYGNNGVAAGDFDNDGFDDLYVCQPAGLPNRLYRNRGDGTFEDVTERAGVGVLDNTACALFADFDNRGHQDLLVLCGTGPLLFVNQGNGTFALKRDAFKFARVPQGTFTHAAIADYDGDGRLDIYFCMYMYYLGLDQYHYPVPYYDARNGPPNCLFHNEGNGTFVETTERAGLNADNDRYSFACAWGDANNNGLPDLFVANDFGSSQLYRNEGNGKFVVVSKEAHVESVGAGMSCCWSDYDNDGRQDIYVPSMWEAAGQRVAQQEQFHSKAPQRIRELYQRHARGNALYRNRGDGTFENVGKQASVEMGRWSWSSDFWDFDHDGFADLYISNGYLSCPEQNDLASFFWRQVVAKSPETAAPALAYERGWNAINQLVRSDNTWHGYARNVAMVNNRNGTFAEASGALGLDFIEDSRAFALADIDHDGRLEVILKSRNAPQVRILRNAMPNIGQAISIRLLGVKSNRDAIGASVTVEIDDLRQTKYMQAGTGFLSQHSKELFFGVGQHSSDAKVAVRWPSGLTQLFERVPVNRRVEITEGSDSFESHPFSVTSPALTRAAASPTIEPLPTQIGTWLIEPLKAPDFSLPDLTGKTLKLSNLEGNHVVLHFWSTKNADYKEQLDRLRAHSQSLSAVGAHIVAINLDDGKDTQTPRSFLQQRQYPFFTLFATDETAGIYNIIYRHLFDRQRDLPIPSSFLLDRDRNLVKIYQGPVNPQNLLDDIPAIPADSKARMQKALPFKGMLIQDAFQRNDFTYGVALYQHGYFDQAADSFKQVIAEKADNADAYYNLGTLQLRRNDLAQAKESLERTVTLQTDYPEAWNNLGMIAAQQGRAEDAIDAFKKSIVQRPDYATAYLNLGNLDRHLHNFDAANESLQKALQLEPDDPEINYSLGMLAAQQNQLPAAKEYLQKAVNLRPAYPEALNNLGVLSVRLQDFANAETQFKTGIRVAPTYDQSYLNLARLYAMRSEKEKARDVLMELLQIEPDNANAKQAIELLK